jgi:hypothetical protein
LIQKKFNFFLAVIFFQFFVIKALDPDWIRIRIGLQPQTLDPDPDLDQMNADPKPWKKGRVVYLGAEQKLGEYPPEVAVVLHQFL